MGAALSTRHDGAAVFAQPKFHRAWVRDAHVERSRPPAAHPRFADGEARRFPRDRLGPSADDGDAAALGRRTEGWPAALSLAALRLRLGDGIDDAMEQLAASGADLFGALTDEVLRSS